jgi:hypothetical protein
LIRLRYNSEGDPINSWDKYRNEEEKGILYIKTSKILGDFTLLFN